VACLTPDRAQAFVFGDASETERDETRAHLANCRACRQWVSALVSQAGPETTSPPPQELAPDVHAGDQLGRYTIVRFIGEGGMGDVFVGHDPKLDREVALKLLHRDVHLSTARLKAEAQTLAQIRDPHIVEVYDVGDSPSGAYVVMELIAGVSLHQWLQTPHPLRAVQEAFAYAASGLASAHRHGIVHGDFKAANVVMGDDGRVCVVDFGLAAPVPDPSVSTPPATAVAGTPGYLAPELLDGSVPSPATDQYAFCVALRRAFDAPSCQGRPSMPVRRAVARGLHPDPQERWPTMDALERALRPGRTSRHRLGLLALGVAMTATTVAVWPSGPTCAEAARPTLAWDMPAQASFRDHLEASGHPWASRAADRSTARLDAFAEEWNRSYEEACADRRPAADAARLDCLAAQAERFNGSLELVAELEPVDPTLLDTLLDLPRPGSCARVAGSVDSTAVASLGLPMARLEGLADAGYLEASSRLATELAPQVESSGSPQLAARLALVEASVSAARRAPNALTQLERASSLASDADDDHLQARAALVVAESLALYELGRGDAVTRALAQAEALLARIDADAPLHRRFVRVKAAARANAGDYEGALALFEQAARLNAEVFGADAPRVAIVQLDVAAIVHQLGEPERAEQICRSALELLQQSLGSDHPSVAGAFEHLGSTLLAQGRNAEASDAFAQTLRIRELVDGPDAGSVSVALGNLAGALMMEGRVDEAVPALERAVTLEQGSDPHQPRQIPLLNHLGNAYRLSGRLEDAERAYARGVVVGEVSLGPDHPDLGVLLGGLAAVQLETQPASSLQTAQRALKIRRASLGAEHPAVAFNLLMVGHAQARVDDVDAAVATLRDAERLATDHPAAARLLPDIRFGLAQVLYDAGRPGARPLAESAALLWTEAGDQAASAEVQAWLLETKGADPKKSSPADATVPQMSSP